jgi:uncharacterized protein (UPF0216 family)
MNITTNAGTKENIKYEIDYLHFLNVDSTTEKMFLRFPLILQINTDAKHMIIIESQCNQHT